MTVTISVLALVMSIIGSGICVRLVVQIDEHY